MNALHLDKAMDMELCNYLSPD